ncbi:MAG: glycoside hydrolase family 25 protein [Lachnospiraceae bacterium]|nr:glycoside hydrolase family 25 protein [Lachnospiraceae bacterium]
MADKRKSGSGMIIVLAISMFFFGFLAGMLLIHFTEVKRNKEANAQQEAVNTTINVTGGTEYVKVYVPKREVRYGTIPINSYDPERFRLDNGFMAYFDENGEKISHLGIDISYHQEKIDWDALKDSPCEFVMIRCGYRGYSEGGLVEDEKFREFAQAATDRNIPFGVYFFTQALNEEEAVAEADFVMDLIKDYPISYPVAIDTEYVSNESARTNQVEMTKQDRTKIVIAFMERIKENGYYPLIYSSENWLRRELDADMLQPYEFWAPQYLDTNDFMYDFTIWQYSDAGHIQGVQGIVDLNISMVDYASFIPAMRQAVEEAGEIIETDGTETSGEEAAGEEPAGDEP